MNVVRKLLRRTRRAIRRSLRDRPTSSDKSQPQSSDMSRRLQPLEMTQLNISRYLYFERLFERIRGIEGDIVECGVGAGDSLIMLCIIAKREGMGRRVWGFDSFEGFPEPTAEDESTRNLQAGERRSDIGLVRQRLLLAGLDEHFVNRQATLVKGFFQDSLHLFRGKQIALLHLDCDLYQSYKVCLETLYPQVQTQGIIAFDEYVNTMQLISFPGAQKAIDEYLGETHSLILSDKETGQYYLVKPE